jgi:hypothetical protein
MANVNKPKGFELADTEGKQVRVRPYNKKSGDVIAIGDPVAITADGTIELFDNGDTSGLLGVSMEYKAATDTSATLVCDDPEAVYEVMANFEFAAADVFLNADVTAGTVSNLQSGASISGAATGATLPFKIIGLVPREGNVVGSFARVYVKPNQHAFKAGVAGI